MHKILRKLKVHPFDLPSETTAPPWHAAMLRHPPAPLPLRSILPAETGSFRLPHASATLHALQRLHARSPNKRRDARTAYVKTPPTIMYDEDRIRDVFYRDHPYELDRPIALEERREGVIGMGKKRVCGEWYLKVDLGKFILRFR